MTTGDDRPHLPVLQCQCVHCGYVSESSTNPAPACPLCGTIGDGWRCFQRPLTLVGVRPMVVEATLNVRSTCSSQE